MKLLIYTSIFLIGFISCNKQQNIVTKDPTIVETKKVIQGIDTATIKNERQLVVEELKRLKIIFASNDKNKIAAIFQFPIPTEKLNLFIDDTLFTKQSSENGDKTTKKMFLQYFNEIYSYAQIAQINKLFQKTELDCLLHKDIVESVAYIKTEPCYFTYKIEIHNRTVTLLISENSNIKYKSKITLEDEIPENDSAICEHMLWWIFKFDGQKLQFVEISGAD